ncbi:hypothetical protein C7212DRAFT_342491 [Tuber magnatum]|uniref:Uncharacterized protein n=1 Tax=Tuber magnatum TaxID=42249 RepID=A0A317STK9_9PEZI|nr:hypothetical protein C7212DRAFT_342491 [Tuber magnatum]
MLPSKLHSVILRRRAPPAYFHLLHRSYLSTKNSPTIQANFFKRYNFSDYTFISTNPVEAEFERLTKARQWGEKSIAKHRRLLERAGFWRLCKEKGWEGEVVEGYKREFEALVGEKLFAAKEGDKRKTHGDKAFEGKTPLEEFLMRNQHPGYKFSNCAPEIEFWELFQAEKKAWEWKTRGWGANTRYEDIKKFKTLPRRFSSVMEEKLDSPQGGKEGSNRYIPWKILFEQFDLGEPPTKRDEAEKILQEIYVNIPDYLDLVYQNRLCGTPAAGAPQPGSSVEFHRLRFPTLRALAIYSYVTNRVYKCRSGGPLEFFLQLIQREYARSRFTVEGEGMGSRGDPESRRGVRELLRRMYPEDWRRLDEEIEERVAGMKS